jgi:hypothetical protein
MSRYPATLRHRNDHRHRFSNCHHQRCAGAHIAPTRPRIIPFRAALPPPRWLPSDVDARFVAYRDCPEVVFERAG